MDSRHQVIAYEELFKGTVNGCTVHPRVVAQRALEQNAFALVLAHNHPSSITSPSVADIALTTRLVKALELVEIHILDHIIVGKKECLSMAQHGFLSQ